MRRTPYLLVVPLLAVLGFVELYPLSEGFILSLSSYGASLQHPGGLNNYVQVVTDSNFWVAVGTSVTYSLGSTALAIAIGLLFTYLVSQVKTGKTLFESILLLPLAVSPLAVGVLWSPSALWDDINTFIHFILHLPYIDVTQPFFYFPIMIISDAWEWSPVMMLVFLSVVSSVPGQIYEAASVHGGSPWQNFTKITIPLVLRSPVTQFLVIIRFVDAMKAFEVPFAWSAWVGTAQIGNLTDTVSLFLFKLLTFPSYGLPIPYISAVAILLFAVTLGASSLLLRFLARGGAI